MQIVFLILLFIIGACFGSFLCCQTRRLRLKETKKPSPGRRSVCLHCGYQLKWYHNIPIFSWLFLKGKCKKCHHKIGALEILSEFGVALAFLMLGTTINITTATTLEWAALIITLILTLVLAFLAIYDGAYGELPTPYLITAIIIGLILAIIKISSTNLLDPIFSFLILGGLYLVLYLISKGKWVGSGDWLLGTAIGLALSSPWLALITLFLANFIACIVMLPKVKKTKAKKIYFGPFLVIAFVITATFASFLQNMI
ncbi:prepilin peptidase [Candidatus Saccharibacteria bacterium]|nr:prepilin peptidase [Candidatus Saccharibacteria bacterium]